jgi:hypothetical protein
MLSRLNIVMFRKLYMIIKNMNAKTTILNCKLDNFRKDELLKQFEKSIFMSANVDILVKNQKDPEFYSCHCKALPILFLLAYYFKFAIKQQYLLYSWISYSFTAFLSAQLFPPATILLFWYLLGIESNPFYQFRSNTPQHWLQP